MKSVEDVLLIQDLAASQRGVFSKADLQTALSERHPSAFVRRVDALGQAGVLRRFARGWYVSDPFDLATLSQRMAPESYVSFGAVLAKKLIIGANPERRIMAVKVGKSRRYSGLGFEIEHFGLTPPLYFGYERADDGVQYATPEKAALDALYFHLRGVRYVFDIYSDLALDKLDPRRLAQYLEQYRNPKFVTFAERTLELRE
jgi:hypothetical protein